jgi:hypothetical protein
VGDHVLGHAGDGDAGARQFAIVLVLPFMRLIHTESGMPSAETRVEGLPAAE